MIHGAVGCTRGIPEIWARLLWEVVRRRIMAWAYGGVHLLIRSDIGRSPPI